MEQKNDPKGFYHRNDCRICGSRDLSMFLDFGNMPLAGGFIREEQIPEERTFPLRIYFCRKCKEVQVLDVVSKDILFRDYRFLASVTKTLSEHFAQYARDMKKELGLDSNSFVVEFGSNDGVLLKPFGDIGIRAIGIEPARNIAEVAIQRGCNVVVDFFNESVAEKISKEHGKADLICGNNVFAHIDDMHEIMRSIRLLLKEDGALVFEVHYLLDLLEGYQYDTMYHEHMMYHSLTAVSHLLETFGMEVFNVRRVPVHSGSIRVYAKNKGNTKHTTTAAVKEVLELERKNGLDREETFFRFAKELKAKRDELLSVVRKAKDEGKRVIGYGASGRASVQLNFCRMGKETIDYVIDASPERYGRVMPGVHIPIVSPEVLKTDSPEFAIMFAWNYEPEILKREEDYRRRGGKFIIPLPQVRIV